MQLNQGKWKGKRIKALIVLLGLVLLIKVLHELIFNCAKSIQFVKIYLKVCRARN